MHLVTYEISGIIVSQSLFFLEQNAAKCVVDLALYDKVDAAKYPWESFLKEELSTEDIYQIQENLTQLFRNKFIYWQEIEPLDTAEAEAIAEESEDSEDGYELE
jgi:hypothetical protein